MTEITPEEQAEFNEQHEIADDLLAAAIDDIPGDVDRVAVLFSMWVDITRILAEFGWTGEELARDVHYHVANATTEGRVQ